jgi:hypothetical protein
VGDIKPGGKYPHMKNPLFEMAGAILFAILILMLLALYLSRIQLPY